MISGLLLLISAENWILMITIEGGDLNSLSRTSKYLMKILRPVLYRLLDLQSTRSITNKLSTEQVSILLSNDKHLAAFVREIYTKRLLHAKY